MAATPDDELTRAGISTVALTMDSSVGGNASSTSAGAHRFAPGSIVAGRYRVVALLGRGGMGEVYRAEDLTLDQPVALKFLPGMVVAGDSRLAQFHNELKTARQVSHKNVCRLYDLGEADGRRFLTMEYVDGEDLSSLLRRIGRLPHDKAVDIARQLCAGIAAAHERGVVHRDLKPSNVMIDADGNVRVTDFGIATASVTAAAEFAGTPQYMAPEQFAGKPASIKSDIYALGLILFEVFTGRRAVDAQTLADLREFHRRGTVTTPSSVVRDLDPAVERTILRCLERDPERRPGSALIVAVGLPGADPLAAALAAGETPSPELIAAAGETQAIGARAGGVLVAAALAGLLAFALVSPLSSIVGRTPLDLPPAVLADRATQAIVALGYPATSGDSMWGFTRFSEYTRWLFTTRRGPQRYAAVTSGTPSAVLFWYRSSPRLLSPRGGALVTMADPPVAETGMRTVVLDGRGRLQEFRSVPPQIENDEGTPVTARWEPAFAAAGLDMSRFTPTTPHWIPRDYSDARAAWEGPLPGESGIPVRVEAASFRGRPVYFSVVGPWTRPVLEQPRQRSAVDRIISTAIGIIGVLVLVAAALLARRNVRAGRADWRGACRLAGWTMSADLAAWLLRAHHVSDAGSELDSMRNAASDLLFAAAILWTTYLALEPYVRKLWPDALLGWSRALTGRLRDPRVGRDTLVGVAIGVGVAMLQVLRSIVIPALGYDAPSPVHAQRVDAVAGFGQLAAGWLTAAVNAVQTPLVLLLIIVLLRLLLRRPWVAMVPTVLVLALPFLAEVGTTNTPLVVVFPLLAGAVLTWVVMRRGLLTFAVAWFVISVLLEVPIMPDPSHWAAAPGNWTLAALALLAALGFYAARAGQQVFGRILPE
jgi:hypothetical protein